MLACLGKSFAAIFKGASKFNFTFTVNILIAIVFISAPSYDFELFLSLYTIFELCTSALLRVRPSTQSIFRVLLLLTDFSQCRCPAWTLTFSMLAT